MIYHKRLESLDWWQARLCLWWDSKGSIPISSVNPAKSNQNWPTEKVFCSIMTMPRHTHLWCQIFTALGWEVLMHLPYSPNLTFVSVTLLMIKNWPIAESLKISWPSFLSTKHRSCVSMELWTYPEMNFLLFIYSLHILDLSLSLFKHSM